MARATKLQTTLQRFLPTPVWTVLPETVSRLSSDHVLVDLWKLVAH